MRTLTNSEGTDEMPHICDISSGSTLFAKRKTNFRERNAFLLEKYKLRPLGIGNVPYQMYCIKPEGRVH